MRKIQFSPKVPRFSLTGSNNGYFGFRPEVNIFRSEIYDIDFVNTTKIRYKNPIFLFTGSDIWYFRSWPEVANVISEISGIDLVGKSWNRYKYGCFSLSVQVERVRHRSRFFWTVPFKVCPPQLTAPQILTDVFKIVLNRSNRLFEITLIDDFDFIKSCFCMVRAITLVFESYHF